MDLAEYCGTGQCGACLELDRGVPYLACLSPAHIGGRLVSANEALAVTATAVLSSDSYRRGNENVRRAMWEGRLLWLPTHADDYSLEIHSECVVWSDSPMAYAAWGDHGVYPYVEEATMLREWLACNTAITRRDVVADLFCGCGRVGLPIAAHTGCRVVACDVEPRALGFCEWNYSANLLRRPILSRDVHEAFRSLASLATASGRGVDADRIILVGNPPFAPYPQQPKVASGSWYGGADGLDVLRQVLSLAHRARGMRYAFLICTLSGPSGVQAEHLFSAEHCQEVYWEPLDARRFWRRDGSYRLVSPAPLADAAQLGKGFRDEDPVEWERWRDQAHRMGYDTVALGVISGRF